MKRDLRKGAAGAEVHPFRRISNGSRFSRNRFFQVQHAKKAETRAIASPGPGLRQ